MAKVARIRRSSSLLSSPIDWLHNGPQSREKAFPDPTDNDKATLENPDTMYTATPRVKRHNRFGPNNRYSFLPVTVRLVTEKLRKVDLLVFPFSTSTCACLDHAPSPHMLTWLA